MCISRNYFYPSIISLHFPIMQTMYQEEKQPEDDRFDITGVFQEDDEFTLDELEHDHILLKMFDETPYYVYAISPETMNLYSPRVQEVVDWFMLRMPVGYTYMGGFGDTCMPSRCRVPSPPPPPHLPSHRPTRNDRFASDHYCKKFITQYILWKCLGKSTISNSLVGEKVYEEFLGDYFENFTHVNVSGNHINYYVAKVTTQKNEFFQRMFHVYIKDECNFWLIAFSKEELEAFKCGKF